MDDLISRQAAIEALGEVPKFKIGLLKKYAEGRNDQWFDDVAALVKLPSAEPEIIRCGDCKYFKVEHGWNCSSYPICEVSPQRIITPDDYCSFAERRET